jgi:ABC-type nitrate/sulfonate/bicarbonate transport system permease component
MKFIGNPDEGTTLQRIIWGVAGGMVLLAIWIGLTAGPDPVMTSGILPSPLKVLMSFGELFSQNELIRNAGLSLGLNLAGYLEAIAICLPLGYIIGLMTKFRFAFQEQIAALRYVPLTALLGLFIVWFGIGAGMKIHFLAFGIVIYLLPIMVQRIDEVDDVYLKTVHTLGATDWQVLRSVYFPGVLSRLSDDIRVLTAVSWTYIIVAEGTGSQGGLGDLIWKAGLRQGRMDKVFALLVVIMVIGVIQDRLFVRLDRELFPYKYQSREAIKSGQIRQQSFFRVALDFATTVVVLVGAGAYALLMVQEYVGLFGSFKPLSYMFGPTIWVFNLLFVLLITFRAYTFFQKRSYDEVMREVQQSKPAAA